MFAYPASIPRSQFYRQYFTPEEIRRLDAIPPASALSHIHLLRVFIRRLLAAAQHIKLTLERRLQMLAVFCSAAATMASLVRSELRHQAVSIDPSAWEFDDPDAPL